MNRRNPQAEPNMEEVRGTFCPRMVALFGFGLLSLLLALSLPIPTAQADPMEVDHFPHSLAKVEIQTPIGSDTVTLSGPTTVEVDLGSLVEDVDHREKVETEIVQMELTGYSSLLGPVTLRLRDVAKDPFHRTLGELKENLNVQAGRLDLPGTDPPFCVVPIPLNCGGTTADSFFDVYFEVHAAGMVLHNRVRKHMETTITHKPPAAGETYENPDTILLYDESGNQVAAVTSTFHTPNPAVGGIAELLPVAGPPAEEAAAPAEDSGWSAGSYAGLGGGLAAAVMAITVGAWYARRRWLR